MNSSIELLEKTLDLLSDESRWAKKAFAYDKWGSEVEPNNPNACAFCILGAMRFFDDCRYSEELEEAHDALSQTLKMRGRNQYISEFNDSPQTTHKDVIDLLKETIRRERGELKQHD